MNLEDPILIGISLPQELIIAGNSRGNMTAVATHHYFEKDQPENVILGPLVVTHPVHNKSVPTLLRHAQVDIFRTLQVAFSSPPEGIGRLQSVRTAVNAFKEILGPQFRDFSHHPLKYPGQLLADLQPLESPNMYAEAIKGPVAIITGELDLLAHPGGRELPELNPDRKLYNRLFGKPRLSPDALKAYLEALFPKSSHVHAEVMKNATHIGPALDPEAFTAAIKCAVNEV